MSTDRHKPKGFKVAPRNWKAINKEASKIRDVYKVYSGEKDNYFDVVAFVEFLAAKNAIELEILENHILGDVAAEVIPAYGGRLPTLKVQEEVYDGAYEGTAFGRFTLAHELGHLFLHVDQPISLHLSTGGQSHRFFEDSEWQANSFAGSLLVDLKAIDTSPSLRSVSAIQKEFGVSKKPAEIMLKKYGRL